MGLSHVRSVPKAQIAFDVPLDVRRSVRDVFPAVPGLVDLREHDVEYVLDATVGHRHGKAVLQITGRQENESIVSVGNLLEYESAFNVGADLFQQLCARHQAHTGVLQRVTVRLGQHAPLNATRGGVRKKESRPQKGSHGQEEPLHAYFFISMKVG